MDLSCVPTDADPLEFPSEVAGKVRLFQLSRRGVATPRALSGAHVDSGSGLW